VIKSRVQEQLLQSIWWSL